MVLSQPASPSSVLRGLKRGLSLGPFVPGAPPKPDDFPVPSFPWGGDGGSTPLRAAHPPRVSTESFGVDFLPAPEARSEWALQECVLSPQISMSV